MGVYITFSIEVHKQDKWQPLIWYSKPSKNNQYYQPELDENGLEIHYGYCPGRVSPYIDMLDELKQRYYSAYPDDMSDELKTRLPHDNYVSKGYFTYSALLQYIADEQRTMLSNLIESRDYQLVKHMQRIEKAVLQKPIKDKLSTSSYLMDCSIKELYEEYMERMYWLVKLRDYVEYLIDELDFSIDKDDIRIIYYYS